jgi:hypothetical protein
LVLGLLCLNPVRADPPLGVFPGQWITYQWESTGNSSGWFPGYNDYLRLSAVATYSVLTVSTDTWETIVHLQGTVEWPPQSVNRTLRLGRVAVINESGVHYAWDVLGERSDFSFNYSSIVHRTGAVVSASGPTAVGASYTFPNAPYYLGYFLYQDRASARSVYFLDDVDAAVGSYVGAWGSMFAKVLNHDYLEASVGRRPAIEISYNSSYYLPPPYNETGAYADTFQYDHETGFLLKVRTHGWYIVNGTKRGWWTRDADILATNMYFPRPELLFPTLVVAAVCLGALVFMLFVSRRMIGKREHNTTPPRIRGKASDYD